MYSVQRLMFELTKVMDISYDNNELGQGQQKNF